MKVGSLILRLTVGAIFVEHGTQKLFGWFGGAGPTATGQFFESLGLRPGRRNALAAGTTEACGGLLLASGLATPLAASGLISVMLTALRTAVWRDGPKVGAGGYEMLLLAAALCVAEGGPGPWSLDAWRGRERSGPVWAGAAMSAGVIGSTLAIMAGRHEAEQPEMSTDGVSLTAA